LEISDARSVDQLSPERVFDRLSAIQLLEEISDDVTGERMVKFRPHTYPICANSGRLNRAAFAPKQGVGWMKRRWRCLHGAASPRTALSNSNGA